MKQKEIEDFIYFLTHSKNLTKAQRLKRDQLLAKTCSMDNDSEVIALLLKLQSNSELFAKISQILNTNILLSPKSELVTDSTIRKHNPRGAIEFLRQFSIDDSLKWYTHKWDKPDTPFSLQDLINNSKNNHNKLRGYCFGEDNVGIPTQLFYHVWNFINPIKNSNILTDQYGERFQTKWADVTNWCNENPGKWPGDFITPQGDSFESVINRFKRTIEFRTDFEPTQKFGRQIKSLIKRAINGSVKIEFSENYEAIGNKLKFYCNVKAIYSGIQKLCDWVSSYKALGDTLFVDLDFHDGCYRLRLFHKGSKMTGPENKIDGLSGDFKSIREILFSACDFELSGMFNDNYVNIIALDKNCSLKGSKIITPATIIPMETVTESVCYTLKFYV